MRALNLGSEPLLGLTRKWCLPAAACCLWLGTALAASGEAQPGKPTLLVVNQGDATVSLVDPDSMRVRKTLHENVPGMVAHEVEVSADGREAYIPLYGDSGLGRPGSDGNELLKLDLLKGEISGRYVFKSGVRPHRAVRQGNLLYVTTELQDSVSIFDLGKWALIGSVPTGAEQSHMLAISSDGRTGYTANVSTGTISALDLNTRRLVRKAQVAPMIQRIALSHDDQTLATADQKAPRLALIDTKDLAVKHWIALPSIGYGATFSADGKTLLITLPQTDQLAIVDLASNSVRKLVNVGPHPQAVLLRPDGRVAYVSCFGSNYVVAVDLAKNAVTGKVETGPKADGMAWAPAVP